MSLQRSASRAVALCALALFLLASPAARADGEVPFLDDDLGTYMGIAHRHWGGPVPTCVANGVTVIPVHAVLFDDPDPEVVARAEQPGCRIWIDGGNWRRLGRVEACTIVVHEWGHLLGFDHSDDPNDPMAEFPVHAPRGCAALAPRARRPAARARASRSCVARARHRHARSARGKRPRSACARHIA
jgi:hypothetical protein